jgi:ribosomal protein S18 acetylase RimI-like enzyme
MNHPEPDDSRRSDGSYTIRIARTSDLEPVYELVLALQDHLEAANPDLWRMSPEAKGNLKGQIAARLSAAGSHVLVAEHAKDGVIGVIFGRITVSNRYIPSQAGQVDQAFVRPEHRRTGVGSELVRNLCRFFGANQVEEITLRYAEGNEEAARFWAAMGFAPRIVTAGASRLIVEGRLASRQRG